MFTNASQIIKKTPSNVEVKKELMALNEAKVSLVSENNDLKKSIKDSYLTIDSLKQEIEVLKESLDKVKSEIKSKTEKNKELDHKEKEILKEIDKLSNEVLKSKEDIKEAGKKKAEINERMNKVISDEKEISDKRKVLIGKEKELEIQAKKLEVEQNFIEAYKKDAEKIAKSIKDDNSALLDKVKEFELKKKTETEIMAEKAKKINSQIGYLEREEKKLLKRIEDFQKVEDEFNNKVKAKESELSKRQEKIDEKEKKYQDAKLLLAEEAAKIKKQYRVDVVKGLGIDI